MYQLKSICGDDIPEVQGLYFEIDAAIDAVKRYLGERKTILQVKYPDDEDSGSSVFLKFDGHYMIIRDLDIVCAPCTEDALISSRAATFKHYVEKSDPYYVIGRYDADSDEWTDETAVVMETVMDCSCEKIFSEKEAKALLAGFAVSEWYGRPFIDDEPCTAERLLDGLAIRMAVLNDGIYVSETGVEYCVICLDPENDIDLNEVGYNHKIFRNFESWYYGVTHHIKI